MAYYISSGVISTGISLYDDNMYISSGGTANNTVLSGGTGYYDSAVMCISNGGVANSTTVNSGGYMYISSGGTANSTTVNFGGYMYISSGGVANSTTVNSYGDMYISSGGVANSTTVNSYGCMYISSGGTATDIVASSGAKLGITVASNTYIQGTSAGSAFEMKNAYISGYTVNSSGYIKIYSGGVANSTTVNSGGDMNILSGGTANRTTVNAKGRMYITNGGTASEIVENGGHVFVAEGANVTFASNTIEGITLSRTSMTVHSNTTANRTTINAWGYMYISSGGVANSTILNSSGRMHISSGGIHRGGLQIAAGAVVSAHKGSTIDFTVAERIVEDGYLINDLSLISDAPAYAITVSAEQKQGEYKLAQGAENFTGSISIGTDGSSYGTLTLGEFTILNNTGYLLSNTDGNLILSISNPDITPPEVVISGNPTEWTNQDVTLIASANEDNCVFQYSFDNSAWFSGNTVTVAENQIVCFKVTDAVGNVTEKIIVVDKIDKTAAQVPEFVKISHVGNNITVDWNNVADDGSGVAGYYIRYGNSSNLTGDGEFVNESIADISGVIPGKWFFQVQSVDAVGNRSEWSSVGICEIAANPVLTGDKNGMAFANISGNAEVELSKDDFASILQIVPTGNAVDTYGMPDGTYQWQVCADGNCFTGGNIISDNTVTPKEFISDADGNTDVFFANASGVWKSGYAAEHQGVLYGWNGTKEQIILDGKNKIADVFAGSTDANVLVLTDFANGDALFVDDIYTALGDQARLSQINEIRAGFGDDIVDLTSQLFDYIGNGVKIYGGAGDDTIWANSGNNTLFGDAGNDRLVGASGDDIIIGGAGNDSMHGGGGNDTFCFGANWGQDTVKQLSEGSVTLHFESGSEANWNQETLTYTDGANSVTVSGVTKVELVFNATAPVEGAFLDAASEKIFEDKNKGMSA